METRLYYTSSKAMWWLSLNLVMTALSCHTWFSTKVINASEGNVLLDSATADKFSRVLVRVEKEDRWSCLPSRELVSWYFEPSQPQRITLGLNTKFNLSPSYSFHKSLYHKSSSSSSSSASSFSSSFSQTTAQILSTISERKTGRTNMFWSLFIFREHSTREPASSTVTYFILRAYTGTGVSHS